jgi:hypothetical protein
LVQAWLVLAALGSANDELGYHLLKGQFLQPPALDDDVSSHKNVSDEMQAKIGEMQLEPLQN